VKRVPVVEPLPEPEVPEADQPKKQRKNALKIGGVLDLHYKNDYSKVNHLPEYRCKSVFKNLLKHK
jgi:hypothetical protein